MNATTITIEPQNQGRQIIYRLMKKSISLFPVIISLLICTHSAASLAPHIASQGCRFHDGGFPAYPPKVCSRAALKNANQSEMDYCSYFEYKKNNKELNNIYDRIMSSGKHEYLFRAELSWLKYRDDYCRMEIHHVCGGSMEPMVKYRCLAKLSKQQADNLKRSYWILFLKQHNSGSIKSIHRVSHTRNLPDVDSYVLKERARTSPGEFGWVTGCLIINKESRELQSTVNFSWTGHLLDTGKVKYFKNASIIRFSFDDAGWGNIGTGTVHIHHGVATENLRLVKESNYGSFDADEYGKYQLKSGKCEIH